ncbi:hypothetical protein [Leptotrichia trevisanii]|mgnify:CR=1 FL=1|uniref:hypothetical protein n=1 Tax=Leptotrichia trevisanii TaxID=109328 RepID=UPI0026EC6D4F|nr:hypothetical protein [Leptotrichia trevisanii]
MKKLLLGIAILGLAGSCARWEDSRKDWESDTSGLKRAVRVYTLDGKLLKEYKGLIRVRDSDESGRISLNLISENNRRVTIDNAIVITEED